jgi:hypothetical protein
VPSKLGTLCNSPKETERVRGRQQLNTYLTSVAHFASLLSKGSVLITLELSEDLSFEAMTVVWYREDRITWQFRAM